MVGGVDRDLARFRRLALVVPGRPLRAPLAAGVVGWPLSMERAVPSRALPHEAAVRTQWQKAEPDTLS